MLGTIMMLRVWLLLWGQWRSVEGGPLSLFQWLTIRIGHYPECPETSLISGLFPSEWEDFPFYTLSSIPTCFNACRPLWDKARLMLLPFTILAFLISDKHTQTLVLAWSGQKCHMFISRCSSCRLIDPVSTSRFLPSLLSKTWTLKPLLAKKQAFNDPTWK